MAIIYYLVFLKIPNLSIHPIRVQSLLGQQSAGPRGLTDSISFCPQGATSVERGEEMEQSKTCKSF